MFADLGHFNVRAVQVSYTIIFPFLFLLNCELHFQIYGDFDFDS